MGHLVMDVWQLTVAAGPRVNNVRSIQIAVHQTDSDKVVEDRWVADQPKGHLREHQCVWG